MIELFLYEEEKNTNTIFYLTPDLLSVCSKPPRVRVTHHDPMRKIEDLGRFSEEIGKILHIDPACLYDGEVITL